MQLVCVLNPQTSRTVVLNQLWTTIVRTKDSDDRKLNSKITLIDGATAGWLSNVKVIRVRDGDPINARIK